MSQGWKSAAARWAAATVGVGMLALVGGRAAGQPAVPDPEPGPPTAYVTMPAPQVRPTHYAVDAPPPTSLRPLPPGPAEAAPPPSPGTAIPPAPAPTGAATRPVPELAPTLTPIDLPYALHLVNASNPTIAIALERVQQAYQRQHVAQVAFLPNLWAGGNPNNPTTLPMFYHHDGLVQNARGQVFTVNKNAVFLGGGVGLNFAVGDAIFAPLVARELTAAEAARARAVTDNVQLDVALTYLDLLRAYGALAVNAETLANAETTLKYARAGEEQGLAKPADANRAAAEVEFRRQERIDLEGQAAAVSARLAQLLLLQPTVDLRPADEAVLPITLVPDAGCLDDLIGVGLMNRPELAADRALVAAALATWRGARWRPLIPTLQLAYYGGSYAGGTPDLNSTSGRDDVYAQAVWELRNGGLRDLFEARETRSAYREANFRVAETSAQVAAEVTTAAKLTQARFATLADAQEGVRQAELTWQRLLKSTFGLGGEKGMTYQPLEALIAEQQLNQARLQYLDEVVGYDRQQFRLYWALGQPPETSMPCAKARPVETPVLPPPAKQVNK